jgi:hypothetical protein
LYPQIYIFPPSAKHPGSKLEQELKNKVVKLVTFMVASQIPPTVIDHFLPPYSRVLSMSFNTYVPLMVLQGKQNYSDVAK